VIFGRVNVCFRIVKKREVLEEKASKSREKSYARIFIRNSI